MRVVGRRVVAICILSCGGWAATAHAAVFLPGASSAPAAVKNAAAKPFQTVDVISKGRRAAGGTVYAVVGTRQDSKFQLRLVSVDKRNAATITKNLLPKVKTAVRQFAGPRIAIAFEAGGFAKNGNPLFALRPGQLKESQVVYDWKTGKVTATP